MRVGYWHVALGAMAFGSAGVSVAGFFLLMIMIALTIVALIFYATRWLLRQIPRGPKPLRPEQTCSQELLDFWAGKTTKYPGSAR